jgi:hypothetical protein
MAAGLLVLGGSIGTGLGYGYQWYTMNQHWFRSLPETPGVRNDDRAELQNTITTSLGDGLRTAVALSQTGTQPPTFFVASNLPDGAVFDVYVHGNPDSLVGAERFDSVLRVKLAEGVGRTDILRTTDGSGLPAGRFNIVAAEADPGTQPEAVRTALSDIPGKGVKLPSWIPGEHKAVVLRDYIILQGKTQAQYEMELKEARGRRAQAFGERFRTLGSLNERLNAALSSIKSLITMARTGNKNAVAGARVKWDALNLDLKPRIEELDRMAAAQRDELADLLPSLKHAMETLSQVYSLAASSPDGDDLEKALEDSDKEISHLKTRIEKAKEAAQAPVVLTQEAPEVPLGPTGAAPKVK